MITVVIALIVVASAAIVAYPLFKPQDELDVSFVGGGDPLWEHLVTQRDATYSAIKDLEFDHAMGKLSDPDYKALRGKYETKAVAILQELDSVGQAHQARMAENDTAIERQVETLRRSAAANGKLVCPRCDTPHGEGDVFCAKCGSALKGARCSACGKRATPGDKFCSKCGKPV